MRILLIAVLFLSATSLCAQDAAPSHAFDYDSKAPLEVQEAGVEHRGGVAIHDISYASPKCGRVPAYLVVPAGKGPFARYSGGIGTGRIRNSLIAKSFSMKPLCSPHRV